ncbi:hypothetical protein BVIET440_270059 [Burkholderia vietnamiensis]
MRTAVGRPPGRLAVPSRRALRPTRAARPGASSRGAGPAVMTLSLYSLSDDGMRTV